ncbi:hypothetical protein Ppb6_02659 [Photorhabdus australis subsp. thailandensis]|uniref:Uncharacterized protein n=1 Tax=Photorhabdus australis subsp. thailandensis TaxID=2805096 RepID=A0A1C0U2J9_9GAMM|nr:hypothetical protein [Photorhabdus australis]OCQ52152.1 hypothetical protein Ppb6_02659 [Photorhabdus australis subsp. thailandensis]
MRIKRLLNNEDYANIKNANKELVNGSFYEGYHGWSIPTPETVEILSENDVNFLSKIRRKPSPNAGGDIRRKARRAFRLMTNPIFLAWGSLFERPKVAIAIFF